MNTELLIKAYEDCITCLDYSYFFERNSKGLQILLLSTEGNILSTYSSINNEKFLLTGNECNEIINLITLIEKSIKKSYMEKTIFASAIRKKTGEIIGYIIGCDHEISNDFMLFLEIFCRHVFNSYKLLLLNSQFVYNYNLSLSKNFTEKELEILELLCKGKKDREISKRLFLSFSTVRTYIENMFVKSNVNNRTLLCCWYYNYIMDKIINK